jgi:hypothetical protein
VPLHRLTRQEARNHRWSRKPPLGFLSVLSLEPQLPAKLHGSSALSEAKPGPEESEEERAGAAAIASVRRTGFGYFMEQTTRPQTIGYALLDSPVALAAWMLDHDTDSYSKISRACLDEKPTANLMRDNVLDNITLCCLTRTGASAARLVLGGRSSRGARGRPGAAACLASKNVR